MNVTDFVEVLGANFYAGVPDSQLKALCNYLVDRYGIDPRHHLIAANEGNAVGLAAGYHLATGQVPVVYMQNSGEGNAINPIASLLSEKIYGIPTVFVVGWRGEPGVHDEPQHIFQGEITVRLLDLMDIESFVVSPETTVAGLTEAMDRFRPLLDKGKSVAFIVRKNALFWDGEVVYENQYEMRREEAIECILRISDTDPVVSTTGKPSREVFELREEECRNHDTDFLTVGSMGHASSVALELAAQKPASRIWCIDGDGAALMHLGAMAVIGASGVENLIHVVLDNGAHETVGGMPTAATKIDLSAIAAACGYAVSLSVDNVESLDRALREAVSHKGPAMIVAKCALGSRADLGRPTISPQQSKRAFMNYLKATRSV